jgi:hypothetical protein
MKFLTQYATAPMAAQALTLQSAFTTLQEALDDLKLLVNAGKTKYMFFSK